MDIDLDDSGLTGILDLSDKTNIHSVDCSFNQITKLILPASVKVLACSGNQLTKLILPAGIKDLYCHHNQLSKLILPPSIKRLYCDHNQLTHLDLPTDVVEIDCSHNQLTHLDIPPGVRKVDCSHNQLSELTLPPSVTEILCNENNLYRFILPPNFNGLYSLDKWPLDDRATRISMLAASFDKLVREYYVSHPYLENSDKLTLRNQLALLNVKQKWLHHYWRPGGLKSIKLMRESMKLLSS